MYGNDNDNDNDNDNIIIKRGDLGFTFAFFRLLRPPSRLL